MGHQQRTEPVPHEHAGKRKLKTSAGFCRPLKITCVAPLTISDRCSINFLTKKWNSAVRRAELSHRSDASNTSDAEITISGLVQDDADLYGSISHSEPGNSDPQQGAHMSLPRIVRDDEDIRCVSPQRLVLASAPSRVLSFPSQPCMSDAERLRLLEEHDPEGFASLRNYLIRRLDRLGL
jgi:hypothetical protein